MRALFFASFAIAASGCALILGVKDVPPPLDEAGTSDSGEAAPEEAGPVVEISAGRGHTCVLRENGSVWCWGFNQYGQLGVSPEGSDTCTVEGGGNKPTLVKCIAHPVRVEIPVKVAELAHPMGVDASCVIDVGGNVWCWGRNGSGELGHSAGDGMCLSPLFGSNEPCNATPQKVEGLAPVMQASAGGSGPTGTTVCAVTMAGAVFCWGNNSSAQLGTTAPSSATPTPVSGNDLASGVSGVSVGFGVHACATKGTSVWCWGTNRKGCLGHPSSADTMMCDPDTCSPTPQQVFTATTPFDAATIHTGGSGSCGLRIDRTIACWGTNQFGLLATGDWDENEHPLATTVLPMSNLLEVGGYTACALTKGATTGLHCWGYNFLGAVGDGNLGSVVPDGGACSAGFPCVTVPQRISFGTNTVTKLGAGYFHNVATLTDGTVWGWGSNAFGQLGHVPGSAGDVPCNSGIERCAPTPVKIDLP